MGYVKVNAGESSLNQLDVHIPSQYLSNQHAKQTTEDIASILSHPKMLPFVTVAPQVLNSEIHHKVDTSPKVQLLSL